MRRLLLIFSITFLTANVFAQWETVGADGFSDGTANNISVAIGSNGEPYVAYKDGANGDKATVMRFNGTSWDLLGTGGLSQGRANYAAIAINNIGVIYLAFGDEVNSYKASVLKYYTVPVPISDWAIYLVIMLVFVLGIYRFGKVYLSS